MMSDPVPFKKPVYEAKVFTANTEFGRFTASGTLCGHIDFRGPFQATYPLSCDEALALIVMLKQARSDVLNHSDSLHDPRIKTVIDLAALEESE
jgi:hypothetical protein